jgi:5-(aminomethyl)-3-furanmethanol phosphate kinase
MSARIGVTVVKLGGSFAFSPELSGILNAIGSATMPVVVVPGGGPFADAVRDAQPRMRLNDSAAHRMALMAMAQYAEALAGLAARLRPAASLAAIRAAIGAGHVPVWSPWPMADGLEALPESWQLTSDSLAAWLAGKLGAERLLMLKHGSRPQTVGEASVAGLVDPLFPDYAQASGAEVNWLNAAQIGALRAILAPTRERLSA